MQRRIPKGEFIVDFRVHVQIREPGVPIALEPAVSMSVDDFEVLWVGTGDFAGSNADYTTISLVQRMNKTDPAPSHCRASKGNAGKQRIPWAGYLAERSGNGTIQVLESLSLRCEVMRGWKSLGCM